jgi:hypothetical protein
MVVVDDVVDDLVFSRHFTLVGRSRWFHSVLIARLGYSWPFADSVSHMDSLVDEFGHRSFALGVVVVFLILAQFPLDKVHKGEQNRVMNGKEIPESCRILS